MVVLAQLKMLGRDDLYDKIIGIVEEFWCDNCGFHDVPSITLSEDNEVIIFCPDCNADEGDDDENDTEIPWKA